MDSGDSSSDVFYRSRGGVGSGAVYLHHKDGTGGDEDDGIFRCQIPDLGGNPQDLFVGIYSSNTGMWQLVSYHRLSDIQHALSVGFFPYTEKDSKVWG